VCRERTSSSGSESTVWPRGIVGAVACIVGALWVAQGTGALEGSVMSGHEQWTVIGALGIVIGVLLLVWAWRIRRDRSRSAT
jgi:predicted anti-sigma-YlaC factor YlaD